MHSMEYFKVEDGKNTYQSYLGIIFSSSLSLTYVRNITIYTQLLKGISTLLYWNNTVFQKLEEGQGFKKKSMSLIFYCYLCATSIHFKSIKKIMVMPTFSYLLFTLDSNLPIMANNKIILEGLACLR